VAHKEKEWISIPMTVDVPYRFAAGQYLTKCLTELRDNGKLFAVECPKCKRVQLPPRIVCAECNVKNEKWVELSHEGTLVRFYHHVFAHDGSYHGNPHDPPFIYGPFAWTEPPPSWIISSMWNRSWRRSGWACGGRLVLRPRKDRTGDLNDILYFDLCRDRKDRKDDELEKSHKVCPNPTVRKKGRRQGAQILRTEAYFFRTPQ